jgi:predicted helicase
MLTISPRSPHIARYHEALRRYHEEKVGHELAVKTAFQTLLMELTPTGWIFIPEYTLANGKRPDGALRDNFTILRGYWEAKDTRDDLDVEVRKKLAVGYPTDNIIFEDTTHAHLYQNGRLVQIFDLADSKALADLLTAFFSYAAPQIEGFERAVGEFRERIPDLALGLKQLISKEHVENPVFSKAFAGFYALCATSLDPKISAETIYDMLVQHMLTERLFRTVFDNPDFTRRNVIAVEIERVIDALTSREFDRHGFQRTLDRFYVAIEGAARSLTDWSEKQAFMNMVYERFFQGYSVKDADTHGIVYTPQEIVDFMCASVEEVLQREFGMSLSTPGVQILDPCTGTGNFVVNLIRRIAGASLERKYREDLFANEIMLLPYYIASLNIEHAYYDLTKRYETFEGVCFVDTLELEGQQMQMFTEANTERIQRQKAAEIRVIIGNPPYNAGQEDENDNNKNRRYPTVDRRIHDTYVKASSASLHTKLYDPYVKFFRWATDRLQGRDGIVCFISNDSFMDQFAFDGMRRHLLEDFTQIYHLDLHGNVRKNPKLSGTTHNVFGIQVGVGITIAIRSASHAEHQVYYHRVPEDWRKEQKLGYLHETGTLSSIDWQELQPNAQHTWLTEGLRPEYGEFLPIGAKEAKASRGVDLGTIFGTYCLGVSTNRNGVVYDFSSDALVERVSQFIEDYNAEVDRWIRAGRPSDLDNFVHYDKIKWSELLKVKLRRAIYGQFDASKIRHSLFRPFTREFLYYDKLVIDAYALFHSFLPTPATEQENMAIWIKVGSEWPMFALATSVIPDLLPQGGSQCFPLYTYNEDGTGDGRTSRSGRWDSSRGATGPT